MDLPYTEQRPWGSFTQYSDNEQTTVKLLDVKPGIRLSYQYHDHRDEEWVVISGDPIITINDQTYNAKPRDRFVINRGDKHRIAGGSSLSTILEISRGHFDENDNHRIEDDFNRSSPKP